MHESAHATASEVAVQALTTQLANRVILPGDDRFDATRRSWNLALDQRPRAVVLAESIDDIEAALGAARNAVNFTEQPAHAAGFFDEPTCARLRRVEATDDPGNLLVAHFDVRLPQANESM